MIVERPTLTLWEKTYLPQILHGLWLTLKHIPRRKFTRQYPEEKPVLYGDYRGAPTLVKDSSSFGLWAGMANNGTVVSPHVHAYGAAHTFAAPGWVWSDATVLYPDTARSLGLNTSDTDAVIAWLREH